MEVITLVGSSGTGKSYQAIFLARREQVRYLIDDGLFIKENRVLGGFSAKREKSSLAAVRRALFAEETHQQLVQELIRQEQPEKLLILGTSDRMTDAIIQRLGLPPVMKRFYIESLVTPEELRLARRQRMKEGKHVIPVPTFEIKKHFSGYFLNPLKVFRYFSKDGPLEVDEKSVVRPTFSYLGKYTISDKVIKELAAYQMFRLAGLVKVNLVEVKSYSTGIILNAVIVVRYGVSLKALCETAQQQVKGIVEDMTSLNVLEVNLQVKGIVL